MLSTCPMQLNDRMPARHESEGDEGDEALRAPKRPAKLTGQCIASCMGASEFHSSLHEQQLHG